NPYQTASFHPLKTSRSRFCCQPSRNRAWTQGTNSAGAKQCGGRGVVITEPLGSAYFFGSIIRHRANPPSCFPYHLADCWNPACRTPENPPRTCQGPSAPRHWSRGGARGENEKKLAPPSRRPAVFHQGCLCVGRAGARGGTQGRRREFNAHLYVAVREMDARPGTSARDDRDARFRGEPRTAWIPLHRSEGS